MAGEIQRLSWGVAVALVLLDVPAPLRAGCNAIPDPPVSFRGVLGRVDRAVARVGDFIVVSLPDRERLKQVESGGNGAFDIQKIAVTLTFTPPFDSPIQFVIASGHVCEQLEPRPCSLKELLCPQPRRCFPPTDSRQFVITRLDDGQAQLGFTLPQTEAAGPLTIAAIAVSTQKSLAIELQHLRSTTCDTAVNREGDQSLLACIDTIALDTATLQAASDPPPCNRFTGLGTTNDYRADCSRDFNIAPKCMNDADEIAFTVCNNGDVVMPMTWSNILRTKPGGFDRRTILGSSPVGAVALTGPPIEIPSSMFLESTTAMGSAYTPKAAFHPLSTAFRPNELTVYGTSDEGDSTLVFHRRLLWGYACAAGDHADQACEPAPEEDANVIDCPDTATGTPAPCVSRSPVFFTCSSVGPRQNKPCTRPSHCPGGACMPGSVCYDLDGNPTKMPCQTDAACPGMECGTGLFDFRHRLTNGKAVLRRLVNKISPQGVCDSGPNEGASCTKASQCRTSWLSTAQCVGYRAEATAYTP